MDIYVALRISPDHPTIIGVSDTLDVATAMVESHIKEYERISVRSGISRPFKDEQHTAIMPGYANVWHIVANQYRYEVHLCILKEFSERTE